MFVRWGATSLDVNSAYLTKNEQLLHVNWVPYARVLSYTVRFVLLRETPLELAAASSVWNNACRIGNQNLALCLDSGQVVEQLNSSLSLSGTQCVDGPHWDDQPRGATYATMRECTTTFAAEYVVTGATHLSWTQTITLEGGLPVYVELPSIGGPWQQQKVSPSSPVTATQSGSAVGLFGLPIVPGPMFNAPLVQRQIARTSPGRVGLGFRGWPMSWAYTFRTVGNLGMLDPGNPPL